MFEAALWWVFKKPAESLTANVFVRLHRRTRFNAIRPVRGDKISVMIGKLRGDTDGVYQEIIRDSLRQYFGDKIEITLLHTFFGILDGHQFDGERFLDKEAQSYLTSTRNDVLIWGTVRGQNVLSLYFTTVELDKLDITPQYRLKELPTSFRLKRDSDLPGSFIKHFVKTIDSYAGKYPERLEKKIDELWQELATKSGLSAIDTAFIKLNLGNLLTRLGEIKSKNDILFDAGEILQEAKAELQDWPAFNHLTRFASDTIVQIARELNSGSNSSRSLP